VYHLHLVFDQYPDDIFKCSPVYIVSESLYNSVIDLGLSGLHNARLISYSLNDNHYQTIQHDGKIPTQNYFMVDINENGEEDFSLIRINDLIRLCVSDRAFRLLSSFNIDNADISELK